MFVTIRCTWEFLGEVEDMRARPAAFVTTLGMPTLFVPGACVEAGKNTRQESMQAAGRLLSRGSLDEAKEKYEKLPATSSDDGAVIGRLGTICHLKEGAAR